MQYDLFEPEKEFRHKSRGRILYKHLSINEKINWHKSDCYAPHFINRYSYMMGIDGNTFQFYLRCYESPILN